MPKNLQRQGLGPQERPSVKMPLPGLSRSVLKPLDLPHGSAVRGAQMPDATAAQRSSVARSLVEPELPTVALKAKLRPVERKRNLCVPVLSQRQDPPLLLRQVQFIINPKEIDLQ